MSQVLHSLCRKGGNGKGVLNELVLQAFGDYGKTMSSAFFTEKTRNSGSATPQLADKKGVRVLIATEPEENEKLQVGRLKQISGNDRIQARDLFQSLFYYTPQFGIFFQCNTIPELSKVDGGVQRRLRVIEFPFDFVENPTMPHQRQADNELKETLVKSLLWKQHFMRMLIFFYQTEVKGCQSLEPPENVVRASKSFLDSCNPIAEWLNENCTLTGDRRDKAKFPEVLDYYKDVHKRKSQYCSVKRNQFYESLRLCGLTLSTGNGYEICHGIVLKPPRHSEDIDDDVFLPEEDPSA